MKKIHISSFALAATLFAACTTQPTSYTIEGQTGDSLNNGEKVYLIRINDESVTDSTIVTNGKFTFTGSIDTAALYAIETGNAFGNLILENGKISINLKQPTSPSGTPLNNEFSQYIQKIDSIHAYIKNAYAEIKKIDDKAEKSKQETLLKEEMGKKFADISKPVFEKHNNDALGAFVLLQWAGALETEKIDSLYSASGDIIKQFPRLVEIIENNKILENTAEGKMFVDFTAENLKGEKSSLSDYVGKGKYTLVDFWASWCGPCRREIPNIAEVYKKYGKKGLEVVSVAVWEKPEDSKNGIKEMKMNWPQIVNAGNSGKDLYGINGIPHIILFGPDGKIVARNLRGAQIEEKVASVIK